MNYVDITETNPIMFLEKMIPFRKNSISIQLSLFTSDIIITKIKYTIK